MSGLWCLTAIALWAAVPSVASADTVALLPLGGRAEPQRLAQIEQILTQILQEQGHRVIEGGVAEDRATARGEAPTRTRRDLAAPSRAEMEAIAAEMDATYVLAAEIEPLRAQYRLHIHVYDRSAARLEDLVVTVLEAEERERLSDVLSAMVRRQGLGADALRLTAEPEDASEERTTAEQERLAQEDRRAMAQREAQRREDEERERREAEEAERQEAEDQARRDQEAQQTARQAWDARAQYGTEAPWLVQLTLGGRYALPLGELPVMPAPGTAQPRQGGGLFDVGIRLGRTFEGVDGLELRGGFDFRTGAFAALGLHVGGAWLGSFFLEPIFIGFGGEVGVIFTLSGAQDVGFSSQISALLAWRPVERFYLEASLPEVGIVTPGSGAVTIGASLRAGYRF